MWVAVGVGGAPIRYSTDNGGTWIAVSPNTFNTAGNGVAWNGAQWVAVGTDTGGKTIAYSTNGGSWTSVSTSTFNTAGTGIAWNGSVWVATGKDTTGNTMYTSPDGVTWSVVAGAPFSGNVANGVATRRPLPLAPTIASSKGIIVADLSGSTQVVTNATVTAASNVILTRVSGSNGLPAYVDSVTAGSFTIKNTVIDNSTYNYVVLN